MHKYILIILSIIFSTSVSFAISDYSKKYEKYCEQSGGTVEKMPAEFLTDEGQVHGVIKKFCTFHIDNGFVVIGLQTFATQKSNIAATYIKKLQPITESSELSQVLDGKNQTLANPSFEICRKLGGSNIHSVASGGFVNNLGQTDICVFGDGSMISTWSLIYIANGRDGYDMIKEKIRSKPLSIKMPD